MPYAVTLEQARQLKMRHFQSLCRAAARHFAQTGDIVGFASARSELDEVAEDEDFTLRSDHVARLLERIGRVRPERLRRSLLAAACAASKVRPVGRPGRAS